MRKGLPMAGNHLMQELVLLTGALDAMVVDYQCIMPSVTDVAKCFHTEVISTADKAKFTGATHISFDPRARLRDRQGNRLAWRRGLCEPKPRAGAYSRRIRSR